MGFNILGTPQNRKSRIVPGLVEQLNRECSEAENSEKKNLSLEQKSSEIPKIIVSDIKDICRGYEEFMGWEEQSKQIPTQITNKYHPTKQQVLEFSKCLIDYKDLGAFIFYSSNYLTALMHSSKEKEFEIDLQELNKNDILLNDLGYKLEDKILVVNGNVGDSVGSDAKNSKITINGDAGDLVGNYAENSKITINGDASDWVGDNAENCEIYVRDNIMSISGDMINLEIYQFKKDIWMRVR